MNPFLCSAVIQLVSHAVLYFYVCVEKEVRTCVLKCILCVNPDYNCPNTSIVYCNGKLPLMWPSTPKVREQVFLARLFFFSALPSSHTRTHGAPPGHVPASKPPRCGRNRHCCMLRSSCSSSPAHRWLWFVTLSSSVIQVAFFFSPHLLLDFDHSCRQMAYITVLWIRGLVEDVMTR